MGLKLRWFRANINFSSRSTRTDFSAPSHGLYRPTYSVYGADTPSATSRSTRDISQPDVATRLPPKQMSRSMPDLGDTPSPPAMAFSPTQQNVSSLHNPQAREVAVAVNPAFAQRTFDVASHETTKTKNKLQLKLNIPATTENHKPSKSEAAVNASKPQKNRAKNKLAPSPPKPGNDKKGKKSNKEVVDLRFGGESES